MINNIQSPWINICCTLAQSVAIPPTTTCSERRQLAFGSLVVLSLFESVQRYVFGLVRCKPVTR